MPRKGSRTWCGGEDLFPATGLHRLLQVLLGYPAPAYHHHGLILDPAGGKLSKSRGSPSLADLRLQGVGTDAIRQRLGFGPLAGEPV